MTLSTIEHPGARYDVVVGPIAAALPRLRDSGPLSVITDERVFALHGDRLDGLAIRGPIFVPEGEQAKQWRVLEQVIERLAELRMPRGSAILAFGGGSVGDLAGLAASLFKRGCSLVHVPTTLLAQADSAIGGKTAIDAAGQKNLVGTFHHPALVLVDPAFLDTLDARQMRSGYAEVVKYGLIDDPGFFDWCEGHAQSLIDGDAASRLFAVEHAIRAKARFVIADPDDRGSRVLLNFGHSFGHALEAIASGSVTHGEAVAVGMVLAFRFSHELGLCPINDVDRVSRHLGDAGLPTSLGQVGLGSNADGLMQLIQADKKADGKSLTLVLTRGIGQAFVARDLAPERLSAFLEVAA